MASVDEGCWCVGVGLACGVVVSPASVQLFQPWDVPTTDPLAERGLPPRGP
jgi:hypothetical protein